MQKLSLKDCSVKGKKALIRVDFNVPLDQEGHIIDDTRIVSSLPSIRYVLENGGSVILMSHLGRPKNEKSPELSLKTVAKRLGELLGIDVVFASDCIGDDVVKLAGRLRPGQVLLLENLRFHNAEEHPEEDPSFARQLAALGDFYVNDAFGAAHRAHSSITDIAKFFPDRSAAGFLMEKEIEFLGSALTNPNRPFHAIIGGSKISSKIGVLKSLVGKVDALLLGGGMAYTFLKARQLGIGNSIHEDEHIKDALDIMEKAKTAGIQLLLPVDHVVESKGGVVSVIEAEAGIPDGYKGVDIGPKTISNFFQCLLKAKTILWNGPLGICEDSRFAKGTIAIAVALPTLNAITIVGGGDSIAAVRAAGVADEVDHLSTGGGASLEYIEYGALPGIEVLTNKKNI